MNIPIENSYIFLQTLYRSLIGKGEKVKGCCNVVPYYLQNAYKNLT